MISFSGLLASKLLLQKLGLIDQYLVVSSFSLNFVFQSILTFICGALFGAIFVVLFFTYHRCKSVFIYVMQFINFAYFIYSSLTSTWYINIIAYMIAIIITEITSLKETYGFHEEERYWIVHFLSRFVELCQKRRLEAFY